MPNLLSSSMRMFKRHRRSFRLLLTRSMSSAYIRHCTTVFWSNLHSLLFNKGDVVLNSLFTPRLASLFSSMSITALRYKLKNNGARTSPCLTPDSIGLRIEPQLVYHCGELVIFLRLLLGGYKLSLILPIRPFCSPNHML